MKPAFEQRKVDEALGERMQLAKEEAVLGRQHEMRL
jgi:hypothetical protein